MQTVKRGNPNRFDGFPLRFVFHVPRATISAFSYPNDGVSFVFLDQVVPGPRDKQSSVGTTLIFFQICVRFSLNSFWKEGESISFYQRVYSNNVGSILLEKICPVTCPASNFNDLPIRGYQLQRFLRRD